MTTPLPQPVHQRQLIRQKVAALLMDRTNAGKRVWPSRVRHLAAQRLPAIGVYTLEEDSPLDDVSPRVYKREVTVLVEILATADEALDDALDTLSAQVEAVLMADPTWGGVAEDSSLEGTVIGFTAADEGDRPFACAVMRWGADYETRPERADLSTLNDFVTAHVDWDLTAPDPDDPDPVHDATDIVTLPQS